MRLYSWVNMYLEGIHAGIQTAHVQGEILVKYEDLVMDEASAIPQPFETLKGSNNYKKLQVYKTWNKYHKVIQVYNGGYSSSLRDRYKELCVYADRFSLPFAQFHEGKDALDGALTAVAIVVPEDLYDQKNRGAPSAEGDFYAFLHSCKHAR